MTEDDAQFVQRCIADGLVTGPVLELGGGYGGATAREIITSSGLEYFNTDIAAPSATVDYIADFETGRGVPEIRESNRFGCVLVLNVLEHTFEPVKILDNAVSLLAENGTVIVIAPSVWPIHNYPIDCCRLLPDWFRRYAEHSGLVLVDTHFVFLGRGRIDSFRKEGLDSFPKERSMIGLAGFRSRVIHRLFNTSGRGVQFRSHIVIGAALRAG